MWCLNAGTNLFIDINEKAAVQHNRVCIQIFNKGVHLSGIDIIVKKNNTHKKELLLVYGVAARLVLHKFCMQCFHTALYVVTLKAVNSLPSTPCSSH
jgi:hypothetical protein